MNTKNIIKRIVDRFLAWKLPDDFSPDCGIHYIGDQNGFSYYPIKPIGTNLFTADQATKMVEEIAKHEIDFLLERIATLSEAEHAANYLLVREGRLHKKCLEDNLKLTKVADAASLYVDQMNTENWEQLNIAVRELNEEGK